VVVHIATFNSISVLNTKYELRYNCISVDDLDRLRTMPADTIVAVDVIDKWTHAMTWASQLHLYEFRVKKHGTNGITTLFDRDKT
jgi:hypothetical protein